MRHSDRTAGTKPIYALYYNNLNFYPETAKAYHELELEGKLKLRTCGYVLVPENPKAEIARAVAARAKYSGNYFFIVGVKTFLDGVVETHTGRMLDDYLDKRGYHGLERFNNRDKMIELITEADKEGLCVHVHSVGNGAAHFMLDCIEEAEKITGDLDRRNIPAHLQFVTEEDIQRMAKTGSVPAVLACTDNQRCPLAASGTSHWLNRIWQARAEEIFQETPRPLRAHGTPRRRLCVLLQQHQG